MRRSLNINTQYLDKFTNKPVKVFASSYLLNIVFPSKSRSVPYKLRRVLRDYFIAYNDYVAQVGDVNQFSDQMRDLFLRFSHFTFLPRSFKYDVSYSWHTLAAQMLELYDTISSFFDKLPSLDLIDSLDKKRHLFLSKLLCNSQPIDIVARAHVIRSRSNRRHATELM